MNAQTERLFGYARTELMGQPMEILVPERNRHHHVADRNQYMKAPMVRSMGVGRDLFGRRKDGKEIPIEIGLNPLDMKEGPHVLASIIDISERQQLQSQLLQAQKMESIGRLAGGVAHDFNNLLTAIIGYAETMGTYIQGETAQEDLGEILKSAQRATSLTRQLLAFSRRQVMTPRVISLNAALTDMEGLLRRLIREDIKLHWHLRPATGNIKVDAGQLEQVIMNLVVNAKDAMPRGGKLTIESSNVELDRDYAKQHLEVHPGPHIMLAVSDTGTGMNEEIQKRLFEPFFTTKAKGEGTGLGLATVYGIVQQSGGSIYVYSHLGVGTTFKVYWPRIQGAATAKRKPKTAKEPGGGKETILITEDEESIRKLAARVLAEKGYRVLVAGDGDEALRIAKNHNGEIHLLLTDLILPGINGRQLATSIIHQHPGAKVLYMSGYTENIIAHHGMLEDGVALLEKPFTPNMLCRKVRDSLDTLHV